MNGEKLDKSERDCAFQYATTRGVYEATDLIVKDGKLYVIIAAKKIGCGK